MLTKRIMSNNLSSNIDLEGHVSDWLPVLSGVPQGSVLGPLFYILLINNMTLSIVSD